MSGFLRTLGTRLQTSSSARLVLYGSAAAGTSYVAWKMNEKSRLELRQRRKDAHAEAIAKAQADSRNHQKSLAKPEPAVVVVENKAGELEESATTEEGKNTGAFDPETGEINWDCPCLGGMAHGPCGPQFREAFSCFVFSEAEPKGVDCVEKFRAMQDCFREHPDVYAEELADDGDEPEPSASDPSTSDPPPSPTGGEGLEPPSNTIPEPGSPRDDVEIPRTPPPLPPSDGVKSPPLPPSDSPRSPPPLPQGNRRPPTIIDPPSSPLPPTIVDPPSAGGPVGGAGGITTTKASASGSHGISK